MNAAMFFTPRDHHFYQQRHKINFSPADKEFCFALSAPGNDPRSFPAVKLSAKNIRGNLFFRIDKFSIGTLP